MFSVTYFRSADTVAWMSVTTPEFTTSISGWNSALLLKTG